MFLTKLGEFISPIQNVLNNSPITSTGIQLGGEEKPSGQMLAFLSGSQRANMQQQMGFFISGPRKIKGHCNG